MSRSPDNEDGCFVAMDTEDDGAEPAGITEDVEAKMGSCRQEGNMDSCAKGGGRTMVELPEEVLEYILSFLSPYQEHKTAALVCKQWYRLIKGMPLLFTVLYKTESEGGLVLVGVSGPYTMSRAVKCNFKHLRGKV